MNPERLHSLIHEQTCIRLLEAMSTEEIPSPGMFQVACRFLKDNDVTGLAVPDSALEELRQRVGDRLPFMRLTGTEDA